MKRQVSMAITALLGAAVLILPTGAPARAALMPPAATASSDGLTLSVNALADKVEIVASSNDVNDALSIGKNGVQLGVAKNGEVFVDAKVTPGEDVSYSLEVLSPATVVEAIDAGLKTKQSAAITKNSQYMNFTILMATVGIPYADAISTFDASQEADAATIDKSLFRYQTFIPTATTDPRNCFPVTYLDSRATKYLFSGDNRGFDPTPATSKTKQDITVDWNANGNLSGYAGVGWSHLLVYNGATLLSDNMLKAGTENMSATMNYESASASSFHLHNDTKNPFCNLSNGIFYDIDVVLRRNGSYSVTGVSLNAPNHEIWFQNMGTGAWSPIFLKTGDMNCLWPVLSGLFPGCNVTIASNGAI